MWHADEGALHAYLDGALDELPSGEGAAIREHLSTCPECAARLEEEQQSREQAIAILSGPMLSQVELPPFEELRLRAEATSPPRVPRGNRLHRIGWAASVVLAIGAGWGLRGGQSDAFGSMDILVEPDLLPVLEASSTTPEQSASAGVLLNEALDRGELSARLVASPERERSVPVQEVTAVDVGALAAQAMQVAVMDVGATDVAGVDGAATDVAAVDVTVMDVATEGVAAIDAVTLQDRLGGELTASPLERIALVDFRASGAMASRFARALPVVRVVADRVANEDVSEERARRPGQFVMTSASRSAAGAPFSNGDASERRRERRDSGRRGGYEGPLVVPDFNVIVIEAIEEGPAAGGTRALQWLTEADTLELLHLPEGVTPTDLVPLEEEGFTELFVQRDGLWLVMRARRRSVRELEGLLERLDSNR